MAWPGEIRKHLIIWDGDDTLWFVEQLYDATRQDAAAYVASQGLDGEAWEQLQRQIDLRNVAELGLSRRRFPTSCVQAYEALAREVGVAIDQEVAKKLYSIGASVFTRPAPLAQGVHDALKSASRFARLVLLTKGETSVQLERVKSSGLDSYFENVNVVPEKSPGVFRGVLHQMGVAASRAWSIGNSLPSDINPALEIGMSAVWIDAHVWAHERRETEQAAGRLFTAASVREAVTLIRSHCAGATAAGNS